MKLGLSAGEIKLVDHQADWKEEFQRIQQQIHEVTGIALARIEHIGSTSIEGIQAKPMIDIAVAIEDISQVEKALFEQFSQIGFLRLKVVLENEIVLAKFTDESYQRKTHIIHLVDFQGKKWEELIRFRDRLRASESLKKAYEAIKLRFLAEETGDMNAYTDYKKDFVYRVLQKQ